MSAQVKYKQILNANYWFLLFALFIMGCAGTQEVVKDDTPQQEVYKYDESFDPLSLDDDDIIIAGDENIKIIDNSGNEPKTEIPTVVKEINGFRVQLLATKNIETASLFQQEASERFNNLEHKTYVIFDAPLYKVRVGDCRERGEAEDLRDFAKQYGYRECLIVKSKIQVEE
jgi:hypothetical protein